MNNSQYSEKNLLSNLLSFCANHIDESNVKKSIYIGLETRKYKTSIFGNKILQKQFVDPLSKELKDEIDECVSFCKKYSLDYEVKETIRSEKTKKPFIEQEVNIEVEYLVKEPFNFLHRLFAEKEALGQPYKQKLINNDVLSMFVDVLYKYYLDNISHVSKPTLNIVVGNNGFFVNPRDSSIDAPLYLDFKKAQYENLQSESMRIGMFLAICEMFSHLIDCEVYWIPCDLYIFESDQNGFKIIIDKPTQRQELNSWL